MESVSIAAPLNISEYSKKQILQCPQCGRKRSWVRVDGNFVKGTCFCGNTDLEEIRFSAMEAEKPIKIFFKQHQAPGDIMMLTAAIRDLHTCYPGWFITAIDTSCPALFENNPYVTKLDPTAEDVMWVATEYELIHRSNNSPYHFVHGFINDFNEKFGLNIHPTEFRGDIYISNVEKSWYSQIHEITGKDLPYWIINAGSKSDFTCKQWERARYQEVVSELKGITFVQVGAKDEGHRHQPLDGDNVIDLIGQTDMRQFVRLMYHAAGVITPVSFAMHLSAAVEMKPQFHRRRRPCIVLAGGREPTQWEAYMEHAYLHTCGMLPCCDSGGCWCSRVEPLGDGDSKDQDNLCHVPVVSQSGEKVPKCMDMITAADVVDKVQQYLELYDY